MGEPKAQEKTAGPETHYVKGITGRDYKTTSAEHASQYIAGGGKAEGKEEAYRGASAAADLDTVAQMGTAEKAAYGVGSGLTLGLGPAAMVGLGLADPGTVGALETDGIYQAGDVAGMVAPALLSGGEAAAGRGVISSALRASPAGLVGRAGTIAEALAGRVLPEAGVMGKLARPALQMATRGATEGALVNLSHTASEAIIQDKPLAWAAISASGVDGALMGGLAGGALGALGAGVGLAGEEAVSRVGAAGGGGEVKAAIAARRIGAEAKDLEAFKAREGGVQGTVKSYHDILEKGEASFASRTDDILRVAKQSVTDSQTTYKGVIATLDKEAPQMVPNLDRTLGHINTDLTAKYAGTFQAEESARLVAKLQSDLENIGTRKAVPDWYDGKSGKYKPAGGPGPRDSNGSWKGWADSRAQLAELSAGARGGVQQDVYKTALNAMDSEIRQSMEAAAESIAKPGLSETYHGALMTETLSKELAEMVGKKGGIEAANAGWGKINSGDLGSMAYSGLMGHPAGGVAIVVGKRLVQAVQKKLEAPLAEAAYRSAMGASAGAATTNVASRMSSSVRDFLKGTKASAPRLAAVAGRSDVGKVKYDMKSYEAALASTEKLTSEMHKSKVADFANHMAEMGHPEMAKEAMDQYQRASDYLKYNMPVGKAMKQAGKMGKMPTPFGLGTKEMKFLRIDRAIKNPLSLLDDLQDGSLSRDAVKAVKYVYPPLHEDLVFRASQEILSVKSEGHYVGADKVAALGLALDAPIDSTLEKGFISVVQDALAANSQPQPGANGQPPSGPPPVISDSSSFQTPLQSSIQS